MATAHTNQKPEWRQRLDALETREEKRRFIDQCIDRELANYRAYCRATDRRKQRGRFDLRAHQLMAGMHLRTLGELQAEFDFWTEDEVAA